MIVPDPVIGPPDVVNPVVPPDTATDVTVPVDIVAQDALVPSVSSVFLVFSSVRWRQLV